MISDQDMQHQVAQALGEHGPGFNIDGIVRDLIDRFGRAEIDDVPGPLFWQIVRSHAVEGVDSAHTPG